ncbi:type II toxin-antitoxin system prevent-host-death family antitoxin [Desulfobacterales bacterium HSG16]|nr:type II toxin-antitoxin system prevent-host-death family antitoxin [Desulfobacterales bacterium HSG16]
MIQVNVKEIERNLSAYLGRAESGETLIITRDGRPVFELRRIEKKSC